MPHKIYGEKKGKNSPYNSAHPYQKKNSAHNKAVDKQQIATPLNPADYYPDMFKQFLEVS